MMIFYELSVKINIMKTSRTKVHHRSFSPSDCTTLTKLPKCERLPNLSWNPTKPSNWPPLTRCPEESSMSIAIQESRSQSYDR